MLLNYMLFWMMIIEGVICLVISLPFGQSVSQTIVRFLNKTLGGKDSVASTVGTVVLAIVALLFLSDVNTCYKYHTADAVLSDGMRIRLITAQRDMYISGFCLFLFMLLRLVYHSMETNLRLERSLGAMKKQAEGASSGYNKLLEENEIITKQLSKLKELVGEEGEKSGDKPLAKLLEENALLSKKLETATKELKSAEAKIDVVKKQAEGQSAAFMKLMDEKSVADKQVEGNKTLETKIKEQADEIASLKSERDSLKTQVQDYDFMFADAKKKAD